MRGSLLIGVALTMIGMAGCGASDGRGSFDDDGWHDSDGDTDADADVDSDSDSDSDGEIGSEGRGQGGGAGTLTAGVWDDNRNFGHFMAYLSGPGRDVSGAPPFGDDEIGAAHTIFAEPAPARSTLEVSLVIDTTGSMLDEIGYLQDEYIAITGAIAERFPAASQRWSLVLYRDEGDEYVTRSFDFTANASAFRDHLAEQTADGGGDFPEAPDQALAAMNALSWSDAPGAARLAFWVADAPHHAANAGALADEVRAARQKGIHIYPVASSGVDGLAELAMRHAAQLTGGRYIFLTDDSGVGGPHAEPTIPCYYVTKLDDALLRMVEIEMTGDYREPADDEILRTGGDPRNGACTLAGGDIVTAF
jgi:hypothetical protein